MQAIFDADAAVLLFFQEHVRCGLLNVIMIFFTTLCNGGIVWLAVGAALAVSKKYRRVGVTVIICIAVCWVINNLAVKNLVARPRPFAELTWLTILIKPPTDWSFPSGHACASFAAAYALTRGLGARRFWWVYIIAAIIAVSRVYVGVHYPTDVIAGIFIGTLGSAIAYALCKKYLKQPSGGNTTKPK